MESIIVTAILTPQNGQKEKLLDELLKVREESRKESGCIQYDVHESLDDDTFVLYEIWEDDAALQHHISSEHYQVYRNQTSNLTDKREVYKMKKFD